MLTLGAKAIKYFLFLLNLLYVITGIILIVVGATIRAKYTDYQQVVDPKLHSVSVFLIIVGFIIFVISFLGCCGACTENRCMILLFSFLITLILIVEICLAIVGYVYASEAKSLVENGFKTTMTSYGNDTEITQEWDLWQTNLNCCGVYSYRDWTRENMTIPWSCCEGPGGSNTTVCTTGPTVHKIGCLNALIDFVQSELEHIGNATLILAIIHILSVFMSCYLARAIKTSQYESV